MKNIGSTDDVYAALQRLATEVHRTPDELLASLFTVPPGSPEAADPIAALLMGDRFRTQFTDADKYITLLSWIAERHTAELGEFIRSQSSGRHYFGLTREDFAEICRRNQARQIDGTPYWAIMNLDLATKCRFLARLLEFIGYRELVIDFVCTALGGPVPRHRAWTALVA